MHIITEDEDKTKKGKWFIFIFCVIECMVVGRVVVALQVICISRNGTPLPHHTHFV